MSQFVKVRPKRSWYTDSPKVTVERVTASLGVWHDYNQWLVIHLESGLFERRGFREKADAVAFALEGEARFGGILILPEPADALRAAGSHAWAVGWKQLRMTAKAMGLAQSVGAVARGFGESTK